MTPAKFFAAVKKDGKSLRVFRLFLSFAEVSSAGSSRGAFEGDGMETEKKFQYFSEIGEKTDEILGMTRDNKKEMIHSRREEKTLGEGD